MLNSSRRLSQIGKQFHASAPAHGDLDAMTSQAPPPRPAWSDLPVDKNGPGRNCWGLFGKDDELGQLNYITPEVTREAAKDVVHGIKVGLDLPLDFFDPPSFNRMAMKHEVIKLSPAVNDDVIHFNPQSGTQWDGFRHVAYRKERIWYNGTTAEQIESSRKIGTDAWAKAGGFATRGVLLDYRRWIEQQGLTDSKSPFVKTAITLSDLKAVAASQNITFRQGDVLILRTGYLKEYPTLSKEARIERHINNAIGPSIIGLDQNEELIRWVWESGIVACAADSPALEMWPLPQDSRNVLHTNFLAGWGMPIGEYFDTEKLSEECAKVGKWSFFFTSIPLNVPGGVGTPVNGIAVL